MKNNNQINVPQAREAMGKFKMQAASEVGSVGWQMVKNVWPGRTKKFERVSRISTGYVQSVEYITAITL